jgi:alkylation response protein AidB-like acyl-CoA dehydrogenase
MARQAAPELGNQYRDDPLLAGWLARALPPAALHALEPELEELGGLAGGELYRLQLADRLNEPRLEQRDARGNRVDTVETTALWREAERLAVRHGLVATAYDRSLGRHARLAQFAKVYLFHPSSDVYTCPLAMTDGAARALLESGDRALIDRAVPHLTARDPAAFWTSGQWMAEPMAAPDAGRSRVRAVKDGDAWRLYGRQWFAWAVSSQMALTLARPEGNPPGDRGLAMFYVEIRDEHGRPNGLRVDRLEDKLGNRKVRTAQLVLEGTHARLVGSIADGTRAFEPMLAVTRTWTSLCAASCMRRGLALVRSVASRREVSGQPAEWPPLQADTLAALEAETLGASLMAFLLVELRGRAESGEIDDQQRALLRFITPLTRLITGRQAVGVTSEVIESLGGAGYMEDSGLPQLLRDAHVLPIGDGTIDVLALDALLQGDLEAGLAALMGRASACVRHLADPRLAAAGRQAIGALERAALWLDGGQDGEVMQSGARRLAMTLARALQLALLCEHAQWLLDQRGDRRGYAAALRFSRLPVDLVHEVDPALDRLLLE